MRKIRTAMFGTGFMGKVHTEAIRRLGNVEVVAVSGSDQKDGETFAASFGIPRVGEWKELLDDKEIDAVHICTPNYLHYGMAKAALEAGKSVLCEKPLTMTFAEAQELAALGESKKLANCVNHNLRCYPLVQQVRSMIAAGELGDILIVNGTYFQDWLLYDTDWNWRAQSDSNGALRAMGDIGSHWMDQIQHVTGLNITSLCADLQTFHTSRKKPKMAVETFTGKKLAPSDYDSVKIDTDDFGAVLVRLGERARGMFRGEPDVGGRKNRFEFEIYGTKCGVAWNQERPDELWIGQREFSESADDQGSVVDASWCCILCGSSGAGTAKAMTIRISRISGGSIRRWRIHRPRWSIRRSRMGLTGWDCLRRSLKARRRGLGWIAKGPSSSVGGAGLRVGIGAFRGNNPVSHTRQDERRGGDSQSSAYDQVYGDDASNRLCHMVGPGLLGCLLSASRDLGGFWISAHTHSRCKSIYGRYSACPVWRGGGVGQDSAASRNRTAEGYAEGVRPRLAWAHPRAIFRRIPFAHRRGSLFPRVSVCWPSKELSFLECRMGEWIDLWRNPFGARRDCSSRCLGFFVGLAKGAHWVDLASDPYAHAK